MSNQIEPQECRSREFPVREDMAYQLKVWRFERVGWYVLVLLVIVTLLGLFSRGPLSSRDVQSSDGRLAPCPAGGSRHHGSGAFEPGNRDPGADQVCDYRA